MICLVSIRGCIVITTRQRHMWTNVFTLVREGGVYISTVPSWCLIPVSIQVKFRKLFVRKSWIMTWCIPFWSVIPISTWFSDMLMGLMGKSWIMPRNISIWWSIAVPTRLLYVMGVWLMRKGWVSFSCVAFWRAILVASRRL